MKVRGVSSSAFLIHIEKRDYDGDYDKNHSYHLLSTHMPDTVPVLLHVFSHVAFFSLSSLSIDKRQSMAQSWGKYQREYIIKLILNDPEGFIAQIM